MKLGQPRSPSLVCRPDHIPASPWRYPYPGFCGSHFLAFVIISGFQVVIIFRAISPLKFCEPHGASTVCMWSSFLISELHRTANPRLQPKLIALLLRRMFRMPTARRWEGHEPCNGPSLTLVLSPSRALLFPGCTGR